MKDNQSPLIDGRIETVTPSEISGWLSSPSGNAIPVLLINGSFVFPDRLREHRPDVEQAAGLSPYCGFAFKVSKIFVGDNIRLFGFENGRLYKVRERASDVQNTSISLISQFNNICRLSQEPGSTAIVCWDGGHNPIGRAKVLYDVARQTRPTALITYQFEEFGTALWQPLREESIEIFAIPWQQRRPFLNAIQQRRITFNTVWISKERYPAFELSSHFIGKDTSIVVDHDDNEAHFSLSKNSRQKFYGRLTTRLTETLSRNLPSHTAASATLAEERQARIVRHAREDMGDQPIVKAALAAQKDGKSLTVGFIGTVRPHKGLIEAARSIKHFNWKTKSDISFHVYGSFNPSSLRDDLEKLGVTTEGNVPAHELSKYISKFDVVLTGFTTNDDDQDIQKYQISSKIGDGLAHGKPVLVPYSESVKDLADEDGIYIFTQETFTNKLKEALARKKPAKLPHSFSFTGASEAFEAAVDGGTGKEGRRLLSTLVAGAATGSSTLPKTLVLVWKQSDSGMYGRRIDQIARSYKLNNPEARVIILEISHITTMSALKKGTTEFNSDYHLQNDLLAKKETFRSVDANGVEYHALSCHALASIESDFGNYLVNEGIFPENSAFILFPVINLFKYIAPCLQDYKCIVDVVDNHFSWKSKDISDTVIQYALLLQSSDRIIFNSQVNKEYFEDARFIESDASLTHKKISVIPNWYQLPKSANFLDRDTKDSSIVNILYSGNLSDRIDWRIFDMLDEQIENVRINIVGGARRAIERVEEVLEGENVVYWGALTEVQVADLCMYCDLAIVPHVNNDISKFMNPLKLEMYKAYGLPTVTMDLHGMSENELMHVARDRSEFVSMVRDVLEARHDYQRPELDFGVLPKSAQQYVDILDEIFSE